MKLLIAALVFVFPNLVFADGQVDGRFEGTCNVFRAPEDDLPEKGQPVKIVLNKGDEVTLLVKDGIRYFVAMTEFTRVLELGATKTDGTRIGKAQLSYDDSITSNSKGYVSFVTPDDMTVLCAPGLR